MKSLLFDKMLRAIFFAAALGYACVSSAHDAGATMDPSGSVASFTGYAWVNCISTGSIPTDHLVASIKDTSPPQDNLLVNLQIIKGERAISTTDPVSGDADFSPAVSVQGGNGTYLLLVNKTAPGARSFIVSYHCVAADGVTHTETAIKVNQFQ
jgi:hypothetical protein